MHHSSRRAKARHRAGSVVAAVAGVVAPVLLTSAALAGPTGIALSADNRLHSFDTAAPSTITGSVALSGIDPFETLLGIDYRPAQPNQLFGLSSFGQLYLINPKSGVATKVGAELDPVEVPLTGDHYGFDFNPVVDRIRVVSDLGENYRLNPNDGALVAVDGALAYVAGDPNEGEPAGVTAAAYTNSDADPATGTTLYDIDSEFGVLTRQAPPNEGGLQTVGSLGLDDFPLFAGFDIFGAANDAYAATAAEPAEFGLPALAARLFGIDLETGTATELGTIGDGSMSLVGLTVTDQIAAIPLPPALLAAPLAAALAGFCHRRMRAKA